MDPIRRKMLAAGAAATAMAAAPRVCSADWRRRSCYVFLRKRPGSYLL
jgi:hypothetical protein